MNDQPKPTGECPLENDMAWLEEKAGIAKPAVVDALKKILSEIPSKPKLPIVVVIQEIAIAALAAERQKHRKEIEAVTMNTSDIETVQQLRDQLAAEQQKVENLHKILGQKRTTIKELRKQLAAEMERGEMVLLDALKLMPEIAYKSIIEGAGVTVDNLPNELQCVCDAALAKVKVAA